MSVDQPAAADAGIAAPRRVVILGSTGSIGVQALEVIAERPDEFTIVGLGAGGSDPALLAAQAIQTGAQVVAVASEAARPDLEAALAQASAEATSAPHESIRGPEVLSGPDAMAELAAIDCDVVLNGITGSVGLAPTLAALEAGHRVALANKESLVVGGDLVLRAAAPGQLVPVDSEHSALAQALRSGEPDEVERLVLTASGGPFRGYSAEQLAGVTRDQALAHPTWQMGPVITINSATLVNKGLEVIEAHLLFGVPYDRIHVVVHPQSVVHSMVEFVDGSTIAQASPPDMRLPIALGLAWPRRVPGATAPCDWSQATSWEFAPLDEDVFPAVALARKAGTAGGTAPGVFNAANEEAVEAFLAGRIQFAEIVPLVGRILDEHLASHGPSAEGGHRSGTDLSVQDVLHTEKWARTRAQEEVAAAC